MTENKPVRAASRKKKETKKTLEEKIAKVLPDAPKEDQFVKERHQLNLKMCADLVRQCAEKSFAYGESLLFSKKMNDNFKQRNVKKDVYVLTNDMSIPIVDVLPRSIYTSTQSGRYGYLDKSGVLYQYDIANNSPLPPLNINSKVPLNKISVIDLVYHSKLGRIYLLNEKWTVEMWEIQQKLSVPVGRVKVALLQDEKDVINEQYTNRYQNLYPGFISISSNQDFIVVNTTCINNTIVFLDPVSLSIMNQVTLRLEDFNIGSSLNRTLHNLKPALERIKRESISFEKLFRGKTHKIASILYVTYEDFMGCFKDFASVKEVSDDHWKELIAYLDQRKDGYITNAEFEFLFELARLVKVRRTESHVKGGDSSLASLDPKVKTIVNEMNKFVEKSRLGLKDAFKIFDADDSGAVTTDEFQKVIRNIYKDASPDDMYRLDLKSDLG